MTTELEQYEPPPVPEIHHSAAVSSIHQTAQELEAAHRIATAICQTSFVPAHFKNKPEETAVAILYGATVGFDPITAVQQIFVISGKPAMYARSMVAIVLAAGHQIWTEREEPGLVTVCGQRAGSDKVETVTWTSQLAKLAGYESNSKYRTDSRSMLYARASGDVARRIAPDALLGMAYNVEEMQLVDNVYVPAAHVTASTKDQVRAALEPTTSGSDDKTAPVAHQHTESSAASPSEPEPAKPETAGISSAQSKKLHASFNDFGITERPKRLAYASKVVGHKLSSSNEMTKAEASAVIEALNVDIETKADPTDIVDADLVPDLKDLWDQVVAAAEVLGMSRWDTEVDFSQSHEGLSFDSATAEQLTAYLEQMSADKS